MAASNVAAIAGFIFMIRVHLCLLWVLAGIEGKARKLTMNNLLQRVIEPPIEELSKLRQELTQGERQVFEFFHKNLDPKWEIYVQPHLNGLRPDFVLMHPNIGIGVFEVKDWNLDAMEYFPKRVNQHRVELWAKKDGRAFSHERSNPFAAVARYKERIYNLYCPRLQQNAGFAAITGGVIFPFADGNRVRSLQKEFLGESEAKSAGRYLPVSGCQELMNNDLGTIFPDATLSHSGIMRPALADDLRGWLVEPDFAKEQRKALTLDSRQRELADSRTNSGYRRIKGPAGSGKSLVLAARASRLISENKSVLIVTFNITLWHYLRDLVVRGTASRGQMQNVDFAHFHDWCKDVCLEAEMGEAYDELFKPVWPINAEIEQVRAKKLPLSKERELLKPLLRELSRLLTPILNVDVPTLAAEAAKSSLINKYDAILVDEGQDFLPLWWGALRNIRKTNGEMLLVADTTQDIYGTARSWTDEAMTGAGFAGDWARLEVSYRLPLDALVAAKDFATKFLPKDMVDLPDGAQGNLEVEPCTLRWIQCEPEDSERQCVDATLAMMRETGKAGLANADITFICNDIDFGRRVVDELGTYSGVRTVHTFERSKLEQTRKKMGFFMGDARVKATTLHSFKGWEARLLVVHVGHAVGSDGLASVYAALTRLKRSPEGSWLTVICSAPELAEYGRTWAHHTDITKPKALEERSHFGAMEGLIQFRSDQ